MRNPCMIAGGEIQEKVFRNPCSETTDYRETTVNAKNVYSGAREIYQWLKAFAFLEVLGSIPSVHMTVHRHL